MLTACYVMVVLCFSLLCTLVHELGHLFGAKMFGFPVLKFQIWGGRAVLKRRCGITDFALGWKPLGGLVLVLSSVARRRIMEDEKYAELRERITSDPALSEEEAQKISKRYLGWIVLFVLGPVAEAAFALLALLALDALAQRAPESLPPRAAIVTFKVHLLIALFNLLPIRIGRAGQDGFNILLLGYVWIMQRVTGLELDVDRTGRTLRWALTPVGLAGMVCLCLGWIRVLGIN